MLRSFALTARGVFLLIVVIGAAIAAYALRQPFLLTLSICAAAVVAISILWSAFERPKASVAISTEPSGLLFEGDPVQLQFRVRTTALDAAVWSEGADWSSLDRQPRLFQRNGAFLVDENRTEPLRRGIWNAGPLRALDPDSLGITTRHYEFPSRVELVVGPRPLDLDTELARVAGAEATVVARQFGEGDELDARVRDYQPGDPIRRIHWRQSAKVDALKVRTIEPPSTPSAHILLDTIASGYSDVAADGTSEHFDQAVRVVSTFARQFFARGLSVTLHESGDPAASQVFQKAQEFELHRALADAALEHTTSSVALPSYRRQLIVGDQFSTAVTEKLSSLAPGSVVVGTGASMPELAPEIHTLHVAAPPRAEPRGFEALQ